MKKNKVVIYCKEKNKEDGDEFKVTADFNAEWSEKKIKKTLQKKMKDVKVEAVVIIGEAIDDV